MPKPKERPEATNKVQFKGAPKSHQTETWHESRNQGWDRKQKRKWNESWGSWERPSKRHNSYTAVAPKPTIEPNEEKKRTLQLRGLPEGLNDADIYKLYPEYKDKIQKIVWSEDGDRNASVIFTSTQTLQRVLLGGAPIIQKRMVRALPAIGSKLMKIMKQRLSQASEDVRSDQKDATLEPIKWTTEMLRERPIKRNLSSTIQPNALTNDAEAVEYRKENRMTIIGGDIPNPCLTIAKLFEAPIVDNLRKQGITTPLPIQAQCWPVLLSGHDCVAVAQTGSGKTLAYLLPALVHVQSQACPRPKADEGPTALIIAPTRELISQIVIVAWELCPAVRTAPIFGGVDNLVQAAPLMQDGVDIIVAIPRRLIHFVQAGVLALRCVTFLVLDEAESSLFMGVGKQVRTLVRQLRPDRQICCFCATWSKAVQKKATILMGEDATRIFINDMSFDKIGKVAAVNRSIKQNIIFLQGKKLGERVRHVVELLRDLQVGGCERTQSLIFLNSRDVMDKVVRRLQKGLKGKNKVYAIHGGLPKGKRSEYYAAFKSDPHAVLCATDVVARGLDIVGLPFVISMFLPSNYDSYVHRIGRTGRAGATGESWALFDPESDRKLAAQLKEGIQRAGQEPPPELDNYVFRGRLGPQNAEHRQQKHHKAPEGWLEA
mmetsp:Transcript_38846/g.69524  ORF Transcript_38846/g.69524 Transcript_38846/m.69524 type:complete len:659 (-) Transcript_38846:175-2151(-)